VPRGVKGIRAVKAFLTGDGSLFIDATLAAKHHKKKELERQVKDFCERNFTNFENERDYIISTILEQRKELLDILQKGNE